MISDNLQEILFEYRDYATEQGASNGAIEAEKIYCDVKFLQRLSIKELPLLSSVMDASTIMVISGGEDLIVKCLRDGMQSRKYYKEIYKKIKENVEIFAELHGQSKVISEHLALTEE